MFEWMVITQNVWTNLKATKLEECAGHYRRGLHLQVAWSINLIWDFELYTEEQQGLPYGCR